VPGRATPVGTRRYAERFSNLPGHFRCPDALTLSSLALGTRRGRPGGIEDLLYRSAVGQCLEEGVNVLNTALSDRSFTSERALGTALRRAIVEEVVSRDEVVVVTKGGELTIDAEALSLGHPQHQLQSNYIDTGILDPDSVANGICLTPAFLRDQIERSRHNLGLETLDLYLVQEPELLLRALGPSGFQRALRDAFEALEGAVRDGEIGAYGLCTWTGFLVPHTDRDHLSLMDVFQAALDVGSADHHLRALQFPYGLAMGEGAGLASQLGPDGLSHAILEELEGTGTAVFASAPLYGGRLVGRLPQELRDAFPEARGDAQAALQFTRSTRGITSAVVGMREPDHVDENLALLRVPPAEAEVPAELFRRLSEGA
jgi:aryl-alcohol dehydrogenase-like predicted oxidoreductase